MNMRINRSRLDSIPREHETLPEAGGRGLEGAAPRTRELAPHLQALREMRGGARPAAQDTPQIGPPLERPQLHVGTVIPSSSGLPSIGDPIERPPLHIGTVSSPLPLSPGMLQPGHALASAGTMLKPLAQTAVTALAGGAVGGMASAALSAATGQLGGSLGSAAANLVSGLPMPSLPTGPATGDMAPSSAAPSGAGASPTARSASDPASGGTDLENGMSNLQQQDPTLFAKIMKDGQSGDGNSLVEDELQAYKEGAFTQQQAIEAVSGAQSLANQNGGGKINNKVKGDAQAALGGSYINGGQTRFEHGAAKFFESFTPIGALVKGIGNATSSNRPAQEDVLTAAQPALQQGGQTAMADLASVDPSLADKFQADAKAGDGNSMVEDLVKAKQEEQASGMAGPFTNQDAQLLGSQIGAAGKGKVNDKEDKTFTETFGIDTLFRGSSALSKAFNKAEDSVGGFMQQLVSPVTDTVGGVDRLAHGDVKGALQDFGNAALGAVSDAAMVVAPEAAPEIEIGSMALRGGLDAGKAAVSAATDGSSLLTRGIKVADKANDYYNDANDAMNLVNGNGNNNEGSQQV
jgi:hypothetical protein